MGGDRRVITNMIAIPSALGRLSFDVAPTPRRGEAEDPTAAWLIHRSVPQKFFGHKNPKFFSAHFNERSLLRRAQWLSVAKIADCAKKITQQFKTRIRVEIVDTVADIPGHANSTDVTSGATTNDRVYLVRKGLRADNVEVTVFHNAFHFQAGCR